MSNHTLGPWLISEGFDDDERDISPVWNEKERGPKIRGVSTCPVATVTDAYGEDERDANARLIAAAPDMLEALERIFELSDGFDEAGSTGPKKPLSWESVGRVAIDLSKNAIAKATGQEVKP